jgi:hypothetical protein
MIINRNSNEILIFKVNFELKYEKFTVFVTLYTVKIYIPGSGAGPKELWLRLQQKVAAPPTPARAPQHR